MSTMYVLRRSGWGKQVTRRPGKGRRRAVTASIVALGTTGMAIAALDWAGLTRGNDTAPISPVAVYAFLGLRVTGALIATIAFVAYLRYWGHQHARSVPAELLAGGESFTNLSPLTDEEFLRRVSKKGSMFSELDELNAERLLQLVTEPQEMRVRVNEEVDLRLQQYIRRVEVTWKDGSLPRVGRAVAVPVIRERNIEHPREMEVEDGRLLTSLEAAALMFRLNALLPKDLPELLEGMDSQQPSLPFEDLPATPSKGLSRAQRFRVWLRNAPHQIVPSLDRHHDIEGLPADADLIREIQNRRVYFAWYETEGEVERVTSSRTTRFSFRSAPDNPNPHPTYDDWRLRKDRVRRALRLPSRFVYIRLEKALSAKAYRLHVTCDDELYVEEANVWVTPGERWLARQDARTMYRSHLTWEEPSGKAFVELSASRLSAVRPRRDDGELAPPLENVFLALRLTEKPPGLLGPASALAFSALTVLWIGGILGSDEAQGIDMVAFTLALPALAASVLGFSTLGPRHGRRSATAIGSVFLSLLLCVAAIFLRVLEVQQLVTPSDLPFKVMGMKDPAWIALTAMGFIVFAVTLGTLIMRLQRYAVLTGVRAADERVQ